MKIAIFPDPGPDDFVGTCDHCQGKFILSPNGDMHVSCNEDDDPEKCRFLQVAKKVFDLRMEQ